MILNVPATIVDGVIKPDQALNLPNLTRVNITVELATTTKSPQDAWESLQHRIAARPVHAQGRRFTRDELHERD